MFLVNGHIKIQSFICSKVKILCKTEIPHFPILDNVCCFVSALTRVPLSKCRIEGVRAWCQVRVGRGRDSLYRAWPVSWSPDLLWSRGRVLPNLSGLLRGWSSNLVTGVVMPVVITLQHLMYYA